MLSGPGEFPASSTGPQWATVTGLEEARARPPPRPPALRILMEPRRPGPALVRGPAAHGAGPGRGEIAVDGPSRSWPPGSVLTAGFVAGLAVESHRPASSKPGSSGMDSLRYLAATTPPPAAPHPLEDLQSARQEYLRTPPRAPAPHGPAGARPPPPGAGARPPGPDPPPSRPRAGIRHLSFLGDAFAHLPGAPAR